MRECEPVELLHGVPLFANLESEQLADLACRVRRQDFAAGETIFRRGDPGDSLYVIHQGRVRIEMPSDDGPPVILRLMEPGEFFGELVLCDGKERSATAVTIEPTSTLALHRDDFQKFLRNSPHAAIHMLAVLSMRLRDTSERLSESIFYDTPSRLARRLLELIETDAVPTEDGGLTIARPLSPEELAELVGSTAERMRQELDSLQQDRILDLQDGRITVLSPTLLRERIHRKPTVGPGSVTIPTWLLE